MKQFLSLMTVVAVAIPAPLLAQSSIRKDAPRAAADGAMLEGVWDAKRGVASFRGIPYAEAPVGERRWRPPVPVQRHDGPRRAADFAPACPQTNRLAGFNRNIAAAFGRADAIVQDPFHTNEDCLFLNVFSSNTGENPARQPVMVWIHGGSNISGEGSSTVYDGSNLARRGVVVVTINYRLGALGFMAHPALSAESPAKVSGNYALLDQIEALRWVQRNIATFGGDPARVTIFGESAGSIDVLHLMASPLAKGLFHRAIAQSGAPMGVMPRLAQAEAAGTAMANAMGLAGPDQLKALRAAPADRIVAEADKLIAAGKLVAGPNVDGWAQTDVAGRIFAKGRQHAVPLLIGTNALEMTSLRYYLPRFERTVAGYQGWLRATSGPMAAKIEALYPVGTDADVELAAIRLTTDLYFSCPARLAARAMAAAAAPAYLYQFTRVLPGGESLGAYHGAEIGYVFDTKQPWLPKTGVDDHLTELMGRYWTQFAATGDPNTAGLPEWPIHHTASDRSLELGDDVAARTGLLKAACDILELGSRLQWGPEK